MNRSSPDRTREGRSRGSRQRQRQRAGGVRVDAWCDWEDKSHPVDHGIGGGKSKRVVGEHGLPWPASIPLTLGTTTQFSRVSSMTNPTPQGKRLPLTPVPQAPILPSDNQHYQLLVNTSGDTLPVQAKPLPSFLHKWQYRGE